jgi:hypothetical protein
MNDDPYGTPHGMKTGIPRKFILLHFLKKISYYPIWRAAVTESDYILSYLITAYRSTGEYSYC